MSAGLLRLAQEAQGDDWLAALRQQGRAAWQGFSLPDRKTEQWKYTSLAALKKHDFILSEKSSAHVAVEPSSMFAQDKMLARVVFIDGHFSAETSSLDNLAEGLEIFRLSEATPRQQIWLTEHVNIGINLEQHGFAALNTSTLTDGICVRVKAGTPPQHIIQVMHVSTVREQGHYHAPRTVVSLEGGCDATVVEHFIGINSNINSANYFCNALTELSIGANARLRYYRLHDDAEPALHIGGVHAHLDADSRLDSFVLLPGSELQRLDFVVNYTGQGAEAAVNGIYFPAGTQHVDLHTNIEHAVPHCTTQENFRGIVSDRARAVFNGRIHIHPQAQKTEAYLSNKNLLTSNKAEVDTKPELEIYADDVRCAHGATIAQLDTMALHYLRTRGIGQVEARRMLSFGFINELVEAIAEPWVADYCRASVLRAFATDANLFSDSAHRDIDVDEVNA